MHLKGIGALGFCIIFAASSHADAAAAPWKKTAANNITTCRGLWIGLGTVPADINARTRETLFVCHKRYLLSHDNATKTADWVLEYWKKAELKKKFKRPEGKSFTIEKAVPPYARATNKDYTNTKTPLARGHLAPSEDFSNKISWLNDSFVFSNVVPQIGPKFNGAIWGTLEEQVRAAGRSRDEIYVITGPVRGDMKTRSLTIQKADNACRNEIKLEGPEKEAFICAASNKKKNVYCSKGVAVPIAVYKIVYDPKAGDAYAFLMPNKEYETGQGLGASLDTLNSYRVNVGVIESVTGLRFFPSLPADKQDRAVNKCASGNLW
jgi:endonuclease G